LHLFPQLAFFEDQKTSSFLSVIPSWQPKLRRFSNEAFSFLCAACCFCVPSAIAQPDFVWNYFRRLAKLLTAGTSAIVEQIGAEEMKYGHCLYPSVEAYFEERRQFIVENEVNSTLLYWWDKAGIAPQSILSEAVHNALAWG